MRNIDLLVLSLEYIEEHIGENIRTADIAQACFCSKSTLEKLFQSVNDFTVHDYIVRRRMMLAARRIAAFGDESILSVALDYGYSSHEAFTRAFKEVWNLNPSEFRGKKFVELFPKIREPIQKGDSYVMNRRSVDISQLYDLFRERRECWFILTDIKSMMDINAISRKAGDLAIIEQMNRMSEAAGEDDVVFRIGGDEFCILTASTSKQYADEVVQRIKAHNGDCFECGGKQIPLALHAVAARYSGDAAVRYSELFAELHIALRNGKE